MKAIPIIRCRNMRESLVFYTRVLDFKIKYPGACSEDPVVTIVNGTAELQLSVADGVFGTPLNIRVDDVDGLFRKYLSRGLDTSAKRESPVHQGPLDQTWGTREFYVNDPNGNTLRFCMPLGAEAVAKLNGF
jgi:catechol 2,3-dioxygenase-like lactoylglutathione lyase family enzyme